MKKSPTAERIAQACMGIIRRSDQIVAMAETPNAKLSGIFSREEIRVTNCVCCELALAVADSESVEDLAANHDNFELMREHVMEANMALVARTTSNPKVMNAIICAEETLIDMLVEDSPTVRFMAGTAKNHMFVVKAALTASFSTLRLLLKSSDDDGEHHTVLTKLNELLGYVIQKLPTKGDLGRAKREIIKTFTTNRKSEVDKNGPSTPERQSQIEAVRELLRKAYRENRQLTLHQACLEAWAPIKGAYPSPKALYVYCHANEMIF